jgi:hypothetical protein
LIVETVGSILTQFQPAVFSQDKEPNPDSSTPVEQSNDDSQIQDRLSNQKTKKSRPGAKNGKKRSRDSISHEAEKRTTSVSTFKSAALDRYLQTVSVRPRRSAAVLGVLKRDQMTKEFEECVHAFDVDAVEELKIAESLVPPNSAAAERLAKRRKLLESSSELFADKNEDDFNQTVDSDGSTASDIAVDEKPKQKPPQPRKSPKPAPKKKSAPTKSQTKPAQTVNPRPETKSVTNATSNPKAKRVAYANPSTKSAAISKLVDASAEVDPVSFVHDSSGSCSTDSTA